jgi:hypothetical protein
MTQYNMNRFLYMWRHGALDQDVTWRGYGIDQYLEFAPQRYRKTIARRALQALGLNYAGEHGLSTFAKLYEVPTDSAPYVLAAWWVWSRLASGVRVLGVQKRAVEGPEGGSGATTLA